MSRIILCAITLLIILTSASYAQQPCDDLSTYPVRFAILGDRTGEHQEGVFGQCVQEVARLRPDFVMTVGDAIEGYICDTRCEICEASFMVAPSISNSNTGTYRAGWISYNTII